MSRPLSRRIAASVAAAAVVAGGIGLGAGTAIAAPGTGSLGSLGSSDGAATPACGVSATKTQYGAAGLVGITLTKEIVGDGTVAPGGVVTYKTTVSKDKGTPPLLRKMADYFPEGFVFESATMNGKEITPSIDLNANSATITSGLGWRIDLSNTAEFVTKYRVPENVPVGTVLDSGASMTPDMWGDQKWNPIGVCVTVRSKNPGEAVTGSLDSSGFGSAGPISSGSAGSAIINDPAGFIGDIIGNVLKSAS